MPIAMIANVKMAIAALPMVLRPMLPSQMFNTSLIAGPVRLRPMMMMTGPVTTGGNILRMKSGPMALVIAANIT